ncbi:MULTISPECIES: DNA polymerase III subunit delta' [unclassified Shewanella]|uniref:DNA polymerase III subunit delta' n=1 Tax=unclassified Shewanella TaxID=196818 RepID=UPI0020066224|nr:MULTISPECIES: DNA polymerase III subunit delta' [unclassified Shewanella]MCK7633263.1 DNA polymerase III subunit delta' [Shewanella sp. JNE17]MCK7648488.1 DNA polymerase III subunit delta' [Shewanella sp. JNE8]MCK7656569.1 DNA polymerase III subunit delta' [Shewanella sp. JNE4-2]UPO29604.1 DNA polymerase III subunit delta' [Shewanella sp. JNE2]
MVAESGFTAEQLPWLEGPRQAFLAQLQCQKIPHAQLVGIDAAFGGELFSVFMARAALCLAPNSAGACGFCKSCQLFAAGNHPDFYQIEADGNQIKVDQIRELCVRLTATAQQSGRRVAIIHHSERLNSASANALLKTLEEPGKDTLLILQSDTPARLMATISSRCQRIPFVAPNKAMIKTWLAQHCHIQEDVAWCLSVVGGPLKLAESLLTDGTQSSRYQSLLQFRKDWAQSLSSGHLCASLLTVNEQQIIDALKVLYLLLRQILLKNSHQDAFIQAQVGNLAAKIMGMCHSLSTMPTVNYLGLCQSYVLEYREITKK